MTKDQWARLTIGTKLRYIGTSFNYAYRNTLCKVIAPFPDITLEIISAGDYHLTNWGNGTPIASSWDPSDCSKFEIDSLGLSLEERINLKIKTLDKKWAQTQAKKGNNYAMLCM